MNVRQVSRRSIGSKPIEERAPTTFGNTSKKNKGHDIKPSDYVPLVLLLRSKEEAHRLSKLQFFGTI